MLFAKYVKQDLRVCVSTTWMSRVTHEWVMSHMNESRMSYVCEICQKRRVCGRVRMETSRRQSYLWKETFKRNQHTDLDAVRARRCICCLQYTATHCDTLQHTATHCNPQTWMHLNCQGHAVRARRCICCWQHTATHCNTLQHTATHCNTRQHTATHCNTLQHTAIHCDTLQHTYLSALDLPRTRIKGSMLHMLFALTSILSNLYVCHGVCVCVCVYLARARAVVLSLKKSKYHCISLHRRAKITEEGIETNVHIGNE